MNNVYPTLGICMKAGLLVTGEFMVERTIKDQTAQLVIIAEDASENTKKKFRNMCTYRNIEMLEFGDKVTLGKALGKEVRVSISILDSNFAKNIKSKIGEK